MSAHTAVLHIQKLESIRTLAAGIAHDFNNLLTAILGNVALAELNAGNPDLTCELLKEARSACQRAAQLTQQLLTFSKGGTPVKTMVDVGRLVKEAASLAARGSNARVETSQAEPTWAANADPGQLAQMVQNLLINAIQSMPDGGEVRVRVENDKLSAETASRRCGRAPTCASRFATRGTASPRKTWTRSSCPSSPPRVRMAVVWGWPWSTPSFATTTAT